MTASTTPPTPGPAPGGPLFQRYLRWAEPYYKRLPPEGERWARQADIWLYTTGSGRTLCAAVLALWLLTGLTMWMTGSPPLLAMLGSGAILLALVTSVIAPWVMPERYQGRRFHRGIATALLFLVGGVLGGLAAGVAFWGASDAVALPWEKIARVLRVVLPIMLAAAVAMFVIQWSVARWRQYVAGLEMAELRAAQERDAAILLESEARLRVLQAQIRPHFLNNTLAALQHWVDTSDPRAGHLLRSLTRFLQQSVEMMERRAVPLEEELRLVQSYLDIMQSRLGERLQASVESAPGTAQVHVPPALVLTLVENAIEHGIDPSPSGGRVTVRVTADAVRTSIEVLNTGEPLDPDTTDGTGLRNSRQRLRLQAGPEATLELTATADGTRALLQLPHKESP